MAKSADAFRTISEVAEWLETPAHVLRFWESKFAQVKPVKRAGGRRYYRPSDMLLLGGIKKLLHTDGMTIKGVQKLLRESGVKHVAGHSPPLDVLAEDADEAVTISPAETAPEPERTDPISAPEVEDTIEAAPSDPADASAEPSDPIPIMPSFAHRAPTPDAPAEDTAPEPETPVAKPLSVVVPEDPTDDLAADPGMLGLISKLPLPITDDVADGLGQVLSRLRRSRDGNGAGQGN